MKRLLHSTIWVKLIAIGMLIAGFTEKSAALFTAAVTFAIAAHQLRAGIREQYWEPPEEQRQRLIADMVWNNTRWINTETPEEGIAQLGGTQ